MVICYYGNDLTLLEGKLHVSFTDCSFCGINISFVCHHGNDLTLLEGKQNVSPTFLQLSKSRG
jgi:hypothetical protein